MPRIQTAGRGPRPRPKPRRKRAPAVPLDLSTAVGFAREPAVLATFGVSHSALWEWIKQQHFPKPINIGVKTARGHSAVAGDVADLRAFVEKQRGRR